MLIVILIGFLVLVVGESILELMDYKKTIIIIFRISIITGLIIFSYKMNLF